MKGLEMRMRSMVQPVLTVLLIGSWLGPAVAARARQKDRVNPDAAAIADFMKRVDGYVALHNKVDAMLPEPSRDGRPEAFVEHHRAFAKLMQQERSSAQPGDIGTKPMRNIIRRLMASLFRGPNGRAIKHSMLEEFTGNVLLRVNQAY